MKRGSFRIATRTFRTRNIRVRVTRVQAQSETVVSLREVAWQINWIARYYAQECFAISRIRKF